MGVHPHVRRSWPTAFALSAALVVPLAPHASANGHPAPRWRLVHYHGYHLQIPRAWPVLDLAAHPRACVRFNRHALYLGRPGSDQRCPAQAAGRTEAILVDPLSSTREPQNGQLLPATSSSGADAAGGTMARFVDPGRSVTITATWNRHPGTIARALHLRTVLPAAAASRRRPPARRRRYSGRLSARAATAGSTAGQVYTGLGFDACSAPSSRQMSAWGSLSYRAIGVYIGGANMACSQPNLTSGWVTQESSAGWHLIPIYVGLQAPGNACGCKAISSSRAVSQGQAAALDAVAQAQAIGLGAGNPLYYDMEGYARGGTVSSSVLTFLSAWTRQLHSAGYKSGVYSSDDSGIEDLASKSGTGYTEPDDIWVASWNGQQSTRDPNLPSGAWANHQRLHQYQGNVTETHGGVTIDIDRDYLDAATAAAGSATHGTRPVSTSPPSIFGSPVEGQTLSEKHGSWSGNPTSYAYQWERCSSSGSGCTPVAGATGRTYTLGQADLGLTIRVLEVAANSTGAGAPAVSSHTASIERWVGGYWLYTALGNVYSSAGMSWYGSPSASHTGERSVVGLAPTPDGNGYWIVDSSGHVHNYGDAPALKTYVSSGHPPIIGITGSPTGGYWLYTASGNVYTSAGASWYGSPSASHTGERSIVGLAPTADGRGYWVVDSSGHVYQYGDAPPLRTYLSIGHPPIIGITGSPTGGYWLYTASGNVYTSAGASWYGSPSASHTGERSVVGLGATADGDGYWVVESSGRVYQYGDAPPLRTYVTSGHPPIIGIAS